MNFTEQPYYKKFQKFLTEDKTKEELAAVQAKGEEGYSVSQTEYGNFIVTKDDKSVDSRIYSELNRTDRYQYNNFPFFYVENVSYEKVMINNEVVIYEPIKNNCWATPAPCVARGIKVKKFMFFNIFYSKDNKN